MTNFFSSAWAYLTGIATIAGCFTLVGTGKASWAEVGPLASGIALALIGYKAGSTVPTATPSPATKTSAAPVPLPPVPPA